MNYAAEVIKAGDNPGEWIVQPFITETDGKDAAKRSAFSADSIKPAIGNYVFCIESWNNSEFEFQQRINDPSGANVVIVGVFADELTRDATLNILKNLNVKGKAALGAATQKMVLGDNLATYAAKIDAAFAAINSWGAGVTPPLPPLVLPVWSPTNLSQNHKLD